MAKFQKLLATAVLTAVFLMGLAAALWAGEAQAGPPLRPLAANWVVTSTLDSGAGTLRQALLDSGPGDSISFDTGVFPPGSPATISLSSALPTINIDNLTINGSNAGVILDGSGTPGGVDGLVINGTSGVSISGLEIRNFPRNGIWIINGASQNTIGGTNAAPGSACSGNCNVIRNNGANGISIEDVGTISNTVSGNYIGADASGTTAAGNSFGGIELANGTVGNQIGGATPGERNIISGNGGDGINIRDTGTDNNIVSGNYIGTDVSGTAVISNSSTGVFIGLGASFNVVGGDNGLPGFSCAGECNLISGNGNDGVLIENSGASNNTVSGNFIGVNVNGTAALGNKGDGIDLADQTTENLIGGNTPARRNLISSNSDKGIQIGLNVMTNTISGNYIGTNVVGTAALPNQYGIDLSQGASGNIIGGNNGTPGGACTGECNLISGNAIEGILIWEPGTVSNTISGNYIGTDVTGAAALGNEIGITVKDDASYNIIGGDTPAERNLISGNDTFYGINFDNAHYNTVSGNFIGTNAAGAAAIGNADNGIWLGFGSQFNLIGGSNPTPTSGCSGECNLLSGNGNNGVQVWASNTYSNTISGNYIGTDVTGTGIISNAKHGIQLGSDVRYNTVGGTTAGERNLISGNDEHGVIIYSQAGETTAYNKVIGNYIGTDATGSAALGNGPNGEGIGIGGDPAGFRIYNRIGGSTAAERNLISGHATHGVWVGNTGTMSNTVSGNYIGADVSGTLALGNQTGVLIENGASQNLIGGSTAAERNIISGNTWDGVGIEDSGTMSNTVSGNFIGTNENGTGDLGNGFSGVYLGNTAQYNTIGGDNATPGGVCSGECNLISGNDDKGIIIINSGTVSNTISGNYIGVDVNGAAAIGNQFEGIYVGVAGATTIGGSSPAERNLISGNGEDGVFIDGSSNNLLSGNIIGANTTGVTSLANGASGIYLDNGSSSNVIGGSNATPTGGCSDECNLISGNSQDGVKLTGDNSSSNTISGNYIGTNASGTAAIGNNDGGVLIYGGSGTRRYNTIGGDTAGEGNLISGNGWFGVSLEGPDTLSNTVQGNTIGLTAGGSGDLGNGGNGVRLNYNTSYNQITENVIAYTKYIEDDSTGCGIWGPTVGRNPFSRNRIYENEDKGICVGNSPNRPVLTEVYTDTYEVYGTAIANSTIEVFSDIDGEDEGRYYEGTTTTDPFGEFVFTKTVPFSGANVTATATNNNGSTSEFALSLSGTGLFEGTGQELGDENSQGCALGDFDVDGDQDAFCANSSPNFIYLNNGSGHFTADTQDLGNEASQAIALNDIDNSGTLDAVIGNAGGVINQVWLNNGSGAFNLDNNQTALTNDNTRAVALEDLNNDGWVDLVVGNNGASNQIYLNNGSGVFLSPDPLTSAVTDTRGLALGDLDGIHGPDIFVANGAGQPDQVWLNNGDGTFKPPASLGAFDSQAVALGYLNDDDHLDAFVASGSGQLDVVWLNDGNGAFTISYTVGISNSNGVAIGRFNNDAYPDVILASDSDQPNYVLLNKGDGTFEINPIPCNRDADSQDIAIGDLDNDGDLDIFVANGDDGDSDEADEDEQANQVLKNLNSLRNRVGPGGGTLDFSQGMPLRVQVPAGALNDFTIFDYAPGAAPDSADAPENMSYAGRAFNLSPENEEDGFAFNLPVTATVYFDPDAFDGSRPVLHYRQKENDPWLDVAETCTGVFGQPSTYSYGSNWLQVAFCHLTDFGLFGLPGQDVYLPLILKDQ